MEWINLALKSSAQSLVVTNLILAGMALVILLVFRYVYPKKPLKPGWVIFLLGLLPVVSILRPGSYQSGDLSINVIKTMSFYDNLAQGNWIPRWAGELNAGFGYPAHLFAYPLPYYFASAIHFMGISFLGSVKTGMITAYLLSGLAIYWWLKKEVKSWPAALGAILYLYAPYHLVDLHFRVAIGELWAMAWMPLTLLAIAQYARTKSRWAWAGIAVGVSLTVLSHQALSLIFLPLALVYGLLKLYRQKLWLISALILGVMLSSWYWLPVLAETKYTHQPQMAVQVWFPPAYQFLYSPWRWGLLFQGPIGELSYIIGYIQLILMITGVFFYFKTPNYPNRKLLGLGLIFSLGYSFMLFKASEPIWNLASILKNLQFSYRFLGVIILINAAIGAMAAENIGIKFRNKWIAILLTLTIGVTILNWGNRKNLADITDQYLRSVLPESTAQGEGLGPANPKWTDPNHLWQDTKPTEPLNLPSGGEQQELVRQNIYRKYQVNLEKKGLVIAHTLYFPGWKLFIDGQSQAIDEAKITKQGEIAFNLAAGKHVIELKFEDTYARRLGEILSLIGILIMTGIIALKNDSKFRLYYGHDWRRNRK